MSAQGTYRFYSVSRQTILLVNGEPLGRERVNNVKNYVPINPLTAEWALRALIDFTLSNVRRFYPSMENPLDGKGLKIVVGLSDLCWNDLKRLKFSVRYSVRRFVRIQHVFQTQLPF